MSDSEKPDIDLYRIPPVEELIAETEETSSSQEQERHEDEEEFDNFFEVQSLDSERAYVHLKGLADHYGHKKCWSILLMVLLGGMIGFQWFLLWQVGTNKWDFRDYEWLLPTLLVQNLGQIIGLAFMVVKSLFKDLDHRS